MPSQPKIDLKIDPANLRSQISRRVDHSFPVFAPLVWHAGHADGEASWFGMPGMPNLVPRAFPLNGWGGKRPWHRLVTCTA